MSEPDESLPTAPVLSDAGDEGQRAWQADAHDPASTGEPSTLPAPIARLGVAQVDKTRVALDADDQWVTYTFRFWNENGFEAGEISLVDHLNEHVSFLYADADEHFEVRASDSHTVMIANTQAIPASTEMYISFTCDFSDVPAGYVITNTVGSNTVTTVKDLAFSIAGTKTVDGQAPGELVFDFELVDESGQVVGMATSGEDGTFVFDPLTFTMDDVGTSRTYLVREAAGAAEGYRVSPDGYTVTLTSALETTEDAPNGRIVVEPVYLADGGQVGAAAFDNMPLFTRVPVEKVWVGEPIEPVTVSLLADGEVVAAYVFEGAGSYVFEGLPRFDAAGGQVAYSVREEVPEGAGYTCQVTGDAEQGFTVTNTVTPPEEPSEPTPSDTPDKPYEPPAPDKPDRPEAPDRPAAPQSPAKPAAPTPVPAPAMIVRTGDEATGLSCAGVLALGGLLASACASALLAFSRRP